VDEVAALADETPPRLPLLPLALLALLEGELSFTLPARLAGVRCVFLLVISSLIVFSQ
jgi:hypothetical protein